jgi:anti-sigma regulatory factor (Ser/Thr protein kinase)
MKEARRVEQLAHFVSHPSSLMAVRRFVAQTVRAWGVDVFPIVLLSDELATNVVDHAHTEFDVRIELGTDVVRVEVSDASPNMPCPRPPDIHAERGRGLLLIDQLSAHWGAERRGGGKAVWFTIASDGTPAATR